MARITIKDFKLALGVTETYDIINAIINEGGNFSQFENLTAKEDIVNFGQGLLASQTLQNDFITALVDRIGLVVVHHKLMQNPFKPFKRGTLEYGRKIEEVFTDLAKEHVYDPERAETEVFKREIPNVKTLFHERNRQSFYKQTISDQQLKAAFTNSQKFEEFASTIIQSMYNASEFDEYKYTKLLIDSYYAKGFFKVVQFDGVKDLAKKARGTFRKMTLPMGTRDFNAMAVHTKSDPDDVYFIFDADTEAEMDVDVLASAFNMSKADFLGRRLVIDGFASTGLKAVMVDREFFMIYDQALQMESQRNGQGLYWNYFFHVWQILSTSRFANAVAFVDNTAEVNPVQQIIVSPAIGSVKAGKTIDFSATIRQSDVTKHTVSWTILPQGGSNVGSMTINADGVVTVPAAHVGGEFIVNATVATGDPESPVEVKGEAILIVQPAN
jgi:Bacterial surface proteins containing Ig-like domains